MKIAINGAGIAGPTLAYWLLKSGHEVLLIEEASQIRKGGYVIDFWGVGYDIAERMDLIPKIREVGYQVQDVRFVDAAGRTKGGFSVDVFGRLTDGRFTSLRRSDLAATIYHSVEGQIETVFGDSIASITDKKDGLQIGFDHASPRNVDLVIGADGLHSRVRRIVFGSDSTFEIPLGYHVAAFEAKGYPHRDELAYVSHGIPGKQISRFSLRDDKTLFLFIFLDDYLQDVSHSNEKEQRLAISKTFADVGWECPEILSAMDYAESFYFDSVMQIQLPRWTNGRIALVGDAASCVSLLAGEGTGLAMAQAYVLAGELNTSGQDFISAFARYERLMMPFLKRKQSSAAKFASSFAPKTNLGIIFRNLVTQIFNVRPVAEFFIGRDLRDDIEIPNYDQSKK